MNMPSEPQLKQFARTMTPIVNELLTLRLIHERVKETIDAECLRILSSGEYRYDDKWYEHRGEDKLPADRIVREVRDAYLMRSEDAETYYRLRADFIESAGWKCERDYCPAAMAETRAIESENTIIAALADLMQTPAIKDAWGDTREEALNLVIGLVVNLSSYRKPPVPTEWLGKSL